MSATGRNRRWIGRVARLGVRLVVTLLAGGLLGAALMRTAPGFGVDERELDPRLHAETIRAIRQDREQQSLWQYYGGHLRGMMRGDLGVSQALNQPVASLLASRFPVTLRVAGIGLACGWLLAILLALPAASARLPRYDAIAVLAANAMLCVPTAVLALGFLYAGGPAALAVALVVFPRVHKYLHNLLVEARNQPHVLQAEAKGLGRARVLAFHVAPAAGPQALALAGVSLSVALGASIPIEVLCGEAGIGQLAWQAALGRDLPLLVNITMILTALTMTANSLAAWAGSRAAGERRAG